MSDGSQQRTPSVRLRSHSEAVQAILASHHVTAAKVVGSVARGEDRPGSDVDLLVEFDDDAGLLDEVGLRLALTDVLGLSVDVIAVDTLQEPVRSRLLADAAPV